MWIFIIIGLVVLPLGWFTYMRELQKKQILQDGGMKRKYNTLISNVLASNPEHTLIANKADLLQYRIRITGGFVYYAFSQNFGHILVNWKIESVIYKKRGLRWSFPEHDDQQQMLTKINQDISTEMNKIILELSHNPKEEFTSILVAKMTNDALTVHKSSNNNETWVGALAIEKSLMNNVEYFNDVADELAIAYSVSEQEIKSMINQSFRKVHGQFIEKRPH